MSAGEPTTAEPVREHPEDQRMLANVAERLLAGQADNAPKIDRFVVLDELGAGGMGQVFAAYDPRLDRKIALKVLRPQASADFDRARARLQSEAMALARLNHPHVVTIFEVGAVDNEIFLAMEFVEGDDLHGWARENPVADPLREDDRMVAAHAVLMQAGRGLAAAHAAGLIHRDFKPANVLVGADGRARVADFGLAREDSASTTEQSGEGEETSSDPTPITRTGALAGTPKYMAPEQRRDRIADALTDQFAFCTAVWEVLFGTHPWNGEPPNEELPDAPRGAPTRLVGALLRGLNPDRAARFATMEDLLVALEPQAARTNHRWRTALAGGLLVLGAGVGWSTLTDRDEACEDLAAELDGVWGNERTPVLRSAVLGSGVPYAEMTWSRLEETTDAYVARWIDLRTQACVAAHSPVVSPTTAGTLGCLAQRRRTLTAFLEVVAEGTPAAISTATLNAQQLPDVGLCGEADFVLTGFETPAGESAAEVQRLRALLARSVALRRAGEFLRAREVLSGHEAQLEALAFSPLSQDYAFEGAQLAEALEELSVEEELLLEAYAGAARSARAALAAEAAGQLAEALAERGEIEAGHRWLALAEEGQGKHVDAALYATLLARRGAVLLAEGEGDGAADAHAASVETRETLVGADSIELVAPLRNFGGALQEAGRYDEAEVVFDRALALARQLGDQHPAVASALHAKGLLATQTGESAQAHAWAEEELAIYRATFGDDHPHTARGLVSLATTTEATGHSDDALPLLLQADAIYEKTDPEHRLDRVAGFTQLIGVLTSLGRADEAATYAEKSVRIRREVLPPSHPHIAWGLVNLGQARTKQGRYADAVSRTREAEEILLQRRGPGHPDLAYVYNGLGGALAGLQYFDDAMVEFKKEIAIVRATEGDQSLGLASPLYNLGVCADALGDVGEAADYAAQSLAVLEANTAPDDPQLSYPLTTLARALVNTERPTEAIPLAERALGLVLDGRMEVRADARGALARALWLSGEDRSRARKLADEAIREYEIIGPDADPNREGLERWRRAYGL